MEGSPAKGSRCMQSVAISTPRWEDPTRLRYLRVFPQMTTLRAQSLSRYLNIPQPQPSPCIHLLNVSLTANPTLVCVNTLPLAVSQRIPRQLLYIPRFPCVSPSSCILTHIHVYDFSANPSTESITLPLRRISLLLMYPSSFTAYLPT